MLDVYMCPNKDCWYDKNNGKKDEHCPECGTELKKMGIRESSNILQLKKTSPSFKQRQENKKTYKKLENEAKTQQRRDDILSKALFTKDSSDDELLVSIEDDQINLVMHEAGSGWMRAGTLLSLNSRDQMIGAGFKALIDQNKILIKQNEQILRELKKINK